MGLPQRSTKPNFATVLELSGTRISRPHVCNLRLWIPGSEGSEVNASKILSISAWLSGVSGS